MESNPQNLHIFEVYKTKLVERFKLSLDFSRSQSISRHLFRLVFFSASNSLVAYNSTSEYFFLNFNHSKKKSKAKVKFSLKLVQNENHFFERKICRVFDFGSSLVGVIFGDQFQGYLLRFYRFSREMSGQVGLQEDFDHRGVSDLGTKMLGVKFQERLLDLLVVRGRWVVLLFERGIKLFCFFKQKYFFYLTSNKENNL